MTWLEILFQKPFDHCLSYFSEALRRPPAEKWALLVAPGYGTDRLPTLDGPPEEVKTLKSLLIDILGYKPENIVVLTDRGVDPGDPLYPSEENVLFQLGHLIKPGKSTIEYFFFFGGHGEQQEAKDDDDTEEDHKDEVMLLPGGGRILDDKLKAILVEPLKKTPDCRFLALVDACHSCTIMDLPHFRCNRVYHSVICMVRRFGRRVKEGSSRLVKTKSGPTLPGTSVISTIARTASVMTEHAISSSHMATVISTIKRCTGFCLRGPEHGPRVICISACKDGQQAFERQDLPSMTQAFINAIKRKPNLSLKELMHSIRFVVVPRVLISSELQFSHDVRFNQQAQISSLNPLHMDAPLFLGLETVS
ncbi:peptidase C14, caspase domain-containing protein [Mycena floridula]|nr:peptidase C14, caspase domain-containing protein [Mycena floridula]